MFFLFSTIRPVKFPATEILALCGSSPVFFHYVLYTQSLKFSHQKLVAEPAMSQTVQIVYMRTTFIRSNAAPAPEFIRSNAALE